MFKNTLLILSLALFSSAQDFLAKKPIVESGRLPNTVGCIYNIFKGSPLASLGYDDGMSDLTVFELTYNNNQKTDDEKYLYPDQWHFANAFACTEKSSSTVIKGMTSYQSSLSESAKVEGGMDFGVASVSFTAGADYKKQYQETQERSELSVLNEVMCSLYKANMNNNIDWTLSSQFVKQVKEAYQNGKWVDFINTYGTHFVYSAVYGAAGRQSTIVSQSDTSKLSSVGLSITAAVKASYGMMSGSVESQTSWSVDQKEVVNSLKTRRETWFIGNPPSPKDDFVTWQREVRENSTPMPLKYNLRPLESIFTTQYFTDMKEEELAKMRDSFQAAVKEVAKQYPGVPKDPDMPTSTGRWNFPFIINQEVPMWNREHTYYLILGADGYLRYNNIYKQTFWTSHSTLQGRVAPFILILKEEDGNVIVGDKNGQYVWDSSTFFPGPNAGKGFYLRVLEGNFAIYNAQNVVVWDMVNHHQWG